MADPRQHLSGVYAQLRTRFDLLNRSTEHNLSYGQANEAAIRSLLTDFLPGQYGIGTGMIVGTDGGSSRQVDVVIYDRSRSNPAMMRDAEIFFADQVHVAIELKTTFTRETLRGALENIVSVKDRHVLDRPWTVYDTVDDGIRVIRQQPQRVLGSILFLGSPPRSSRLDLVQICDLIAEEMERIPLDSQPELVGVLSHALSIVHRDIDDKRPETHVYAAFALQDQTGSAVQFPAEQVGGARTLVDLSASQLAARVYEARNMQATQGLSSAVVMSGDVIADQPTAHPLASTSDAIIALDVERAFLSYVFALETLIRARRLNPRWNPLDYLGSSFGEGIVLRPAAPR